MSGPAPRTTSLPAAIGVASPAAVVLGLAVLYVAAYPVLFRALRPDVASILVLGVLPAGLLYGLWGGVAAAAVMVPLNFLLLSGIGPDAVAALYSDWAGAVTGVGCGVAAGAARDLLGRTRTQAATLERERNRLEEEIARAERSERILARTNLELEYAREQALRAARAKSVLLGRASHELRTPVAAILGYVELLQEELAAGQPSDLRRDLGHVHHSARHLAALLDDLLDITRLESGKLAPQLERVEVGAVVEGVRAVAAPLAERRGNALVVEVEAAEAELVTDPRRLEQILLNLVGNACKFTDHGRVTLAARRAEGGGVTFVVTDTGIGMTPEQAERAFEEFYQADPAGGAGGTGLGLAIARHLCAVLGARIELDTAAGKGTTFRVAVPAAPAPALTPAPAPRASAAA